MTNAKDLNNLNIIYVQQDGQKEIKQENVNVGENTTQYIPEKRDHIMTIGVNTTDNTMLPIKRESSKIKREETELTEELEKTERKKTKEIENTEISVMQKEIEAIKSGNRLNEMETTLIKQLYHKDISNLLTNPKDRKIIDSRILKEYTNFTQSKLDFYWRKVKNEYYNDLKRIPVEVLINRITDHTESLIESVLEHSEKDVTNRLDVVIKAYKLIADVNQVTSVAPNVQINFIQEINKDSLLNPNNSNNKFNIIDIHEDVMSKGETDEPDEN